MAKKVAVVTGSNKGIGFGIVKGLCENFDGDVYLTARDESRGLAAVKKLNDCGYKPKFFVLDVTVPKNARELRDHILELYGGLDLLVNNAAIVFTNAANTIESFEPFEVRETIRVNYLGLRDTCDIFFPILKPHARVVNLSSYYGHLSHIPGKHLRDILASSDLTEKKLTELVTSFVKAAESGYWAEEGWPQSAYIVSKVAVSALSRVQQRELMKDESRPDIVVNHVHPGNVYTDMNRHMGQLTIEEGAAAPLYLALLSENCSKPKGDYVSSTKTTIDWVHGPLLPLENM